MPRFSRILSEAALLTGGLFLFSMLAIGAFQQFFHTATAIWMMLLAILGYQIHRRRWRTLATTEPVIGLSSLLLFLVGLLMAFTSSPPIDLTKAFGSAANFCLTVYLPFFWLPFGLGALVGNMPPPLARTPAPADHIE